MTSVEVRAYEEEPCEGNRLVRAEAIGVAALRRGDEVAEVRVEAYEVLFPLH